MQYRSEEWEEPEVRVRRVDRDRDRIHEPPPVHTQAYVHHREAPRSRYHDEFIRESIRRSPPPVPTSSYSARRQEPEAPYTRQYERVDRPVHRDRDSGHQYSMPVQGDGGPERGGEYVTINVVQPEYHRFSRSSHHERRHHDRYRNDMRQQYFLRDRGMADHDRLLAELRDERGRRARQSVLDQERWGLGDNRDDDEHDEEEDDDDNAPDSWRRRRRRSWRESRQDVDDDNDDDADAGPSSRIPRRSWSRSRRRHQKRPVRDDLEEHESLVGDKDSCCEELLRFFREDARLQRSRWRQTRTWQEAMMRQLTAMQLQMEMGDLAPPPPYPGLDNDTAHGTMRGRTSGNEWPRDGGGSWNHNPRPRNGVYVYHRPPSIGGSGLGPGPRTPPRRSSRGRGSTGIRSDPVNHPLEIRIGFMFLVKGHVIQSSDEDMERRLTYAYEPRARSLKRNNGSGARTLHDDEWLIDEMKRFYSTRVAIRRWVPPVRRLALAKMVRVCHVYQQGV